ncbi:MAG TPA: cobalamin-binding protein [Blastocatellia bacterium]|nr:cobalamin-binding protein [Blastocatellia bacterium]HMV81608.1 cobalamin-binding protein [Blastocatellia bacterium]HMY71556.1 cobalamin-binding protein [Blastocatellia bacterium]HNG31500.1 cobalamin-binding protein [Blastocatellia bacterium]
MTEPRIVSLIASATEIVNALGFEAQLIGRSHECDFPPGVERLPVCTSPKFAVEGLSYEIDQRVKAVLQESLSVYRVDADLLERLQPTHVITQSQCEVCAVSLKDVEQAVCRFTSSRPALVSLEPNSLADVWADIRRVGASLDAGERAEYLIGDLQQRMRNISAKAQTADVHPTVAYIEWIEPLMAGGNWMPELIEMAGGVNLFGEAGKHSPWMTWEELVAADPDVIFIAPCGFDIARTIDETPALTGKPEWQSLQAVRTGRVVVADGNQYFNRPGPRLTESLEILAEVLHPGLFDFGHEKTGWVRL